MSKPRLIARVDDSTRVVFYPPANPQFGFRGTYALRVGTSETLLDSDSADRLSQVLAEVARDIRPWQDRT